MSRGVEEILEIVSELGPSAEGTDRERFIGWQPSILLNCCSSKILCLKLRIAKLLYLYIV